MPKYNGPAADGAAARAGADVASAERHPDTTQSLDGATTIAIARRRGDQSPCREAKILRFRACLNAAGTLLGFFSAELPSGQIINSFKLMRGPRGVLWIAMPDSKRRGPDDRLILDDRGRPIYDAVIEFRDRDARDRFNALLLAALLRAHPEPFADEAR
jgi:hypothetical protein